MVALGVRRLYSLIGAAGLAFCGCGKDQGSAASPSGSAGTFAVAGSAGSATGGKESAASAGGTSLSGAAGAAAGVAGSFSAGGSAGALSSDGSAGALSVSGNTGVLSGGGGPGGNRAGAGGAAAGTAGAAQEGGGAGSGVANAGAPPVTGCTPGSGFVGQLKGPGSPVPNGGIFTTDPKSVHYGDANLDGVIAAYPASDQVYAIDVDVHEAVVTATAGATPGPAVSASRTDFWIADDHALLKVELDPKLGPTCCPGFDVRSGMRISFKATEVSTFIRLGVITAATNFVAGVQGSCVLVAEPAKIDVVDFYQMVRVSAKVGDSTGSGADFAYWRLGLSDVIMYDFMSANPNLQKGQTVTFVGPVSPNAGYRMLIESNHDWVKVEN